MQTILLIDDDESLRDTIAFMLEQEEFKVLQAADGRDCAAAGVGGEVTAEVGKAHPLQRVGFLRAFRSPCTG